MNKFAEDNKEEFENDNIPNEFESVLEFPAEFLKNNELQNKFVKAVLRPPCLQYLFNNNPK